MVSQISPLVHIWTLCLYILERKAKKQLCSCVHVCAQMHVCVDVYAYSGSKSTPTHTRESTTWLLKQLNLDLCSWRCMHTFAVSASEGSSRVRAAVLARADFSSVLSSCWVRAWGLAGWWKRIELILEFANCVCEGLKCHNSSVNITGMDKIIIFFIIAQAIKWIPSNSVGAMKRNIKLIERAWVLVSVALDCALVQSFSSL